MKRRLRSTFPLVIALLFIPLLMLVGFLLNHILMFVEFFTVKNTVITILVIYAIIANWVIVHLQFDKKDKEHLILQLQDESENNRRRVWELQERIDELKNDSENKDETN
jgi:hypothetical protein